MTFLGMLKLAPIRHEVVTAMRQVVIFINSLILSTEQQYVQLYKLYMHFFLHAKLMETL